MFIGCLKLEVQRDIGQHILQCYNVTRLSELRLSNLAHDGSADAVGLGG